MKFRNKSNLTWASIELSFLLCLHCSPLYYIEKEFFFQVFLLLLHLLDYFATRSISSSLIYQTVRCRRYATPPPPSDWLHRISCSMTYSPLYCNSQSQRIPQKLKPLVWLVKLNTSWNMISCEVNQTGRGEGIATTTYRLINQATRNAAGCKIIQQVEQQ